MSPGLLNTSATVWRPTFAKSATSAARVATWTRIGVVRCTLQGNGSRYDAIAGAYRYEATYTLFTAWGTDLRPADRIEIDATDYDSTAPGIDGPSGSSPNVYTIESGPLDDAGRRAYQRFSVKRSNTTSEMQ